MLDRSVICPDHTLSAHHHLDHLPEESRTASVRTFDRKKARKREKKNCHYLVRLMFVKTNTRSSLEPAAAWKAAAGLVHLAYSFFWCILQPLQTPAAVTESSLNFRIVRKNSKEFEKLWKRTLERPSLGSRFLRLVPPAGLRGRRRACDHL